MSDQDATDETVGAEALEATAVAEAGAAPEGASETADAAGLEPPAFEREDGEDGGRRKRAILSVPLDVVISVGRANPTVGQLLSMRRDSLLELDTKVDDPVDLIVGRKVIARGELQEIEESDGRLGVRLTEIVDLSQPY